MIVRNRSGQFLYFTLTSVFSGNVQTGIASAISGRVAVDATAQAVMGGTISEVGGGQYRANLFAADTDGLCLGYLFTASGCTPVNFSVITQANLSGQVFLGSGSITSGLIASGIVFIASGPSVTIGSGQVWIASGTPVVVYSGQLSGQPITLLSGTSWLSSGNPITNLDKSGYALSSGGISAVTANALQRNLSGVQVGAHVNSLCTAALKLTSRFNALSGTTFQTDGSTVQMTQGVTHVSGIVPIGELGVGA